MPELRHIAIHVEEPTRGGFTWVLTERDADQWHEIERAESPSDSYQRAMADGLWVLQQMVDDLEVGPRGKQAQSARPDRRDASAPPSSAPPPAKSSYFGFGPAR